MASRRTFSLFSPRLIFTSASISVSVSILQGIARFSSSLSPHTKFTFKCDKDNSKWAADSSTNTNDCTEEENLYAILTDNRHGRWNITQDWVNYETEENEETSPSEQSMKRDAHKICRILDNGIKDYTAFEQRFAPFISKLTPQLVCRVISSCSNNVVLPAISFFFWTQHQPGYRHNSATFDAVIHFAAKSHDFHLMSRLMKECKRCGFSFTPKTFSFVIDEGGTLKYHVLDAVLRAINDISERDRRVKSRDAFDALLSTLCNANQLDIALQVLRGMVPTGFWPTVHTYNILVAALCREGRLEDAKQLMEDMKEKGCSPTIITYNRLLKAYIQKNKLREASYLLDLMTEGGCSADSFTYTQLIDVACNSRLPGMGLKLLRNMVYSGVKPMQSAYNKLVECFEAVGQFDEADKLILEMEENGYEKTAR